MRFVGAPRSLVLAGVAEGEGFRHLGERMLAAAKDECPVSESDDEGSGGATRDSLEVRFIGGADPRILIGSKTRGEVLGYLTDGTEAHWVEPVNAKALRWTQGGTVFFSAGHMVSGIEPNDFILRACRAVAHDSALSA